MLASLPSVEMVGISLSLSLKSLLSSGVTLNAGTSVTPSLLVTSKLPPGPSYAEKQKRKQRQLSESVNLNQDHKFEKLVQHGLPLDSD